MKAALLHGPERILIEEIADPHPSTGEVMIRPEYAGICGTDISHYLGHRIVPYPFILGHEVIGRIAALGDGVDKFRIGQRVLVEPNYPCGSCRLCLSGRGAVCSQKGSMGVNQPGCFAEYASAPAEFVWPLPDTISDKDAATIEPLAVSMHGFIRSGASQGDTIAVLGCGVVGLLLIHASSAAGVKVIAHDTIPGKLEMAKAMGAIPASGSDEVERLWQKENVTAVFECAGVQATVDLALKASPRGSRVMLLGLSSLPAAFVPMRLVREGIDIYTSMIYDHPKDFAYVIDQVARGVLHPARVVTHTYPFDAIGQALKHAATGEAGKIHIRMT
ncbi:MAG: alcohol dehydrogenase catalytic domain-containing protein [Acidobacteria bacterium]|nr:alcohol dehydrogenase catalytic domain-containing protein [Acidobacteriota bacterium]